MCSTSSMLRTEAENKVSQLLGTARFFKKMEAKRILDFFQAFFFFTMFSSSEVISWHNVFKNWAKKRLRDYRGVLIDSSIIKITRNLRKVVEKSKHSPCKWQFCFTCCSSLIEMICIGIKEIQWKQHTWIFRKHLMRFHTKGPCQGVGKWPCYRQKSNQRTENVFSR